MANLIVFILIAFAAIEKNFTAFYVILGAYLCLIVLMKCFVFTVTHSVNTHSNPIRDVPSNVEHLIKLNRLVTNRTLLNQITACLTPIFLILIGLKSQEPNLTFVFLGIAILLLDVYVVHRIKKSYKKIKPSKVDPEWGV